MAYDINSLLQMLQNQYQQANTAGLARYENLMRGVNDAGSRIAGSFNKAEQLMSGMGTTARADIGRNALTRKAASTQNLTSRGLGNTTITATNDRGIDEDADRAMADVNERVAGARANLNVQRAGSQLGVANLWSDAVLSRQDQGPDASLYANLIQSLAANGNGQGGGGGGGGGHSYNFGGINRSPGPPGGQGFFGSVGGGGTGGTGGVQTFTNPNAAQSGPITQAGTNPGEFVLAGRNGMGGMPFDPRTMVATRPGYARMRTA